MSQIDLEAKLENLEKEVSHLKAAAAKPRYLSWLLSGTNFIVGTLLVALVLGSVIYAVTVPNTFVDGTVISAADINANFTGLATAVTANEGAVTANAATGTANASGVATNVTDIGTNTANIGTNNTIIAANTSGVAANLAAENGTEVVYLKDVKPNSVSGGTCSPGSWLTRDLNVIENPFGHPWITGPDVNNQFTLVSGTYLIEGICPAFSVDKHKCKLTNISDSTDTVIGTNGLAWNTYSASDNSAIRGIFNITGLKTFEIQHRCVTEVVGGGFGATAFLGVSEIYTTVKIKRLGD